MKKILTIAAACLALTACNEKFIASPVNDGFGYLDINLSTNDDIVVSTKAVLDAEKANSYNITIINSESTTVRSKTLGTFTPSDYILPAGTYTVSAESISTTKAEEGNGEPRLYGSNSSVTIIKDDTTPVTIACAVANACVSAKTVGFNTWFKAGYTIKVKRGTREKTLTEDSSVEGNWDENKRVFYNIVEENTLTWTINATNTANEEKVYTGTINLEAGKWYQLTFTASSANGTISGIEIDATTTITGVPGGDTIDPFKPAE